MLSNWHKCLPAISVVMMFAIAASPASGWTIDDLTEEFEPPWLSSMLLRNPPAQRGNVGGIVGQAMPDGMLQRDLPGQRGSSATTKIGEAAGGDNADEEPIETDRDSFTFAKTTVGTGRIMVESAYSFIENRKVANSNSFPELITRIGLTDRLEFRLGWNYEVGGGGDVSNGDAGGDQEEPGLKRESEIMYGFKYELNQQQSWIPGSACIVQGATPTSGPNSSGRVIVAYVFGWTFFDVWKLDSALRYETAREAGDNFNQWAPSVVLKTPVFDRCNVHAEYFGIFTDGRATNTNSQYISPGISYLLTPSLEVGVRLGWGISQDSANFFSNVGFGVLF